jgi:predicted nucleotidyltransferase component of viral defense system
MLNYFQAQRLASKEGVPAEIIEKDYLIELVLFYLARDKHFKDKLIFRGGTALKKIYFPKYRFSEDIDFLVEEKENLVDDKERLDNLLQCISNDHPFQLSARVEPLKDRLHMFIIYNIIPEIRTTKELKIDILKDELIPSSQRKRIFFTYPEFEQEKMELNTYILESVVSDKISRILDIDDEPRDLYDLWYLLKLNLDIKIIKKEFSKRHGFSIHVFNLLSEITKENFKRNWTVRLERQIKNLPLFEVVIKDLKKLIEEKFMASSGGEKE